MSIELRRTGRDIIFSICEWGDNNPWEWGRGIGHMWRTTYDIGKCFYRKGNLGVVDIIDKQVGLEVYAGPGGWNDPDMLRIGSKCLSYQEQVTHFSFWAFLNAPLMAGNDPRNMSDEEFRILTNAEVIAINQDTLGKQGFKLKDYGDKEIWQKQLADNNIAILLFNRGDTTETIEFRVSDLLYATHTAYFIRDLWSHEDLGVIESFFSTEVPAHGVRLLRLKPQS